MLIKSRVRRSAVRTARARGNYVAMTWALLLLSVPFAVGVVAERNYFCYRAKRLLTANWPVAAVNYLASLGTSAEHLTIDIKHKHYQQLAACRNRAIERRQITSDLKNYVPARIRYRDRTLRADMRLKGEWIDHLETDKWSLRVKLQGQHRLFGMKKFSIQHPATRSFIDEWFYHRAMARAGVIALRYDFVDLTINGLDKGIYALEETFAKELVDHNQRREGIIVRLNAAFRYRPFSTEPGSRLVKTPGLLRDMVKGGIGSQHAATVVAYDQDKFHENETLQRQYHLAVNLLQAFRDGKAATHEVFAVEEMAMYFALSELTGALWTADDWSDMRFYYNPITSRLEPISVEGAEYKPITSLLGAKYTSHGVPPHDFHPLIFRDPQFYAAYILALEEVSQPAYLDKLLEELDDDLTKQLRVLHREWPQTSLATEVFRQNAKTIRTILHPAKGLHAFLSAAGGGHVDLDMAAIQPLPVEVLGVSMCGQVTHAEESIVLAGMPAHDRPRYREIAFSLPPAVDEMLHNPAIGDALLVHYRLLGSTEKRTAAVFSHPRCDASAWKAGIPRADPNVDQFEFLHVDDQQKTITIHPGTWVVEQNIVLPAGYYIHADAGLKLLLRNRASLVSYSPLRFSGTEDQPIVIVSPDSTGQGVFVVNAEGTSILQRVSFQGLAIPHQSDWELTGAVTFHRSPVEFHACEFINCLAEDALNVFQSSVVLHDCSFADLPSDAFDGDFTTGQIVGCCFTDIAGDAIDLSGSEIEIGEVSVYQVGDKGLSVGESSRVDVSQLQIEQARLAIAVKDYSVGLLDDIQLSDCGIGMAVFRKKPHFGPARLTVNRAALKNVRRRYIVEPESSLIVDGANVPPNEQAVKVLLYGDQPVDLLGDGKHQARPGDLLGTRAAITN